VKRRLQFAAVALLLVLGVAGASAQGKESKLRTLHGSVVDKDENPIRDGAVVFLKNLKTSVVKTYIAEDNGDYRFSGLDPNVDYEVHAEHQELASAKRAISSFDSRKDIVIHLKLNRKRE